jgi:hypothetical protein
VRWYAVLAALPLLFPQGARAAEDLNGAARELAGKTAALVGRGEPVSLTWRNVSSLGAPELAAAQRAFESALREAGARIGEASSLAEGQVTLSENSNQFLLVEQIRKGDEQQVWIAGWMRPAAAPQPAAALRLERTLLWRQDDQILDAAVTGDTALVLSRSWITWLTRQNGQWTAGPSMTLPGPKTWPRDLRGRIRIDAGTFQVSLPGMTCSGGAAAPSGVQCHLADDPWVLDSASHGLLLGNLASGRNYFEGRVAVQNGAAKTVGPFFSAAAAGDPADPSWALAMLDGRAQVFGRTLDARGSFSGWGSDLAGLDPQCGRGQVVLATKPVDAHEPDAVQAYAIGARAATPVTQPLAFSGPVTALWSAGSSAIAVSHDLITGKYEVYVVTLGCAP